MIALPIAKDNDSGKRLWRSLPHLWQDAEFAEVVRDEVMPAEGSPSRRRFLQVMGASMALAGLTACRRPVERIMPFARQPEELIPGVPLYYATAMPFRGSVYPLVVKSSDGRPTKVEGNSQHPATSGSTNVFAQASLLDLYDPDRSRTVLHRGERASWDAFVELCQGLGDNSTRLAVIARPSSSPTAAALRARLSERFGEVRWITYRSEGDDAAATGIQAAFGRPLRPTYDFSQAHVIVSLDADFLGPTARNFASATHSFAQGRKLSSADASMSRLYVAESTFSVTGAMADHRKRMRSADVGAFAHELAGRLGAATGAGGQFSDDAFFESLLADLLEAGSRGVVLAGETQPPEVHALCAAINASLGSVGTVLRLLDTGEEPEAPQGAALQDLANDMRAGAVDAALMLGVNPAYDAPVGADFAGAMAEVSETIHVGLHQDETARLATWHVPEAHYLEAWGDGRAWDGTLSVVQPLIAPLYEDARSDIEILALMATGGMQSAYDLVRDTFRPVVSGAFEDAWRKILHDGYAEGTAFPEVVPEAPGPAGPASSAGGDSIEVVWRLDPTLLDGSYANNAWCQELPDPVTKIVWDNVAVMSPATAEALGVEARYSKGRYYVDVIRLTRGEQSVELPVWIVPGLADGSIAVTLGYGRSVDSNRPERSTPFWDTDDKTDIYGHGALASGVGRNVAPLRDASLRSILTDVDIAVTGRTYRIITTQDYGVLDIEARPLLRIGTLDEYRSNPTFALESEVPTPGSDEKTDFQDYPMLWQDRHPANDAAMRDSSYYRNQWGMVIDLNACTGCGTCILACQAENNVQVVGKEEVGNGRELHWLRLDRYFVSENGTQLPDDPQMVLQPVPCQHCENAPCEAVCPVAATVHSPDGTNQMVYNRCIGTRYCANNCPYKVRRFNYFNWSKTIPETVQMAQNPNVTVRSRGVMEKCSFCVQRIRGAQRRAELEDRALVRGEVLTACQQACPAEAITFGDLNDAGSEVSRLREDPRAYTMLAELNVKPRVSYLARVRNPNPDAELS